MRGSYPPEFGRKVLSRAGKPIAEVAESLRVSSGLVPSMGSIGDRFDNAVIESFWARMQVELLDRRRWRTRVELANAIFEYLEIFHTASADTVHRACAPPSSTRG